MQRLHASVDALLLLLNSALQQEDGLPALQPLLAAVSEQGAACVGFERDEITEDARRELLSKLCQLGRRLELLEGSCSAAIQNSGTSLTNYNTSAKLHMLFLGLDTAVQLAELLGFVGPEAAEVSRAAALVLGTGQRMLQAASSAGSASSAAHGSSAGSASSAAHGSSAGTQSVLSDAITTAQIGAMHSMLDNLRDFRPGQDRRMAPCAVALFPPEATMRWLHTVTGVLQDAAERRSLVGLQSTTLAKHTQICLMLLSSNQSPAFSQLQSAAQADAALQRRLAVMLTSHSLPAAVADLSHKLKGINGPTAPPAEDVDVEAEARCSDMQSAWQFMDSAVSLGGVICMRQPVMQQITSRQPDMVQLAVQLMTELPLACPRGIDGQAHADGLLAGVQLLQYVLQPLALLRPPLTQQQQELAAAAGWQTARLLPKVATVMRQQAYGRLQRGQDLQLALALGTLPFFQHPVSFITSASSPEELVVLLEAADFMLRLMPIWLQLIQQWDSQALQLPSAYVSRWTGAPAGPVQHSLADTRDTMASTAIQLWNVCTSLGHDYVSQAASEKGAAGSAGFSAVASTAGHAMWQLHTTACRLVLWADREPQLWQALPDDVASRGIMERCLCQLLYSLYSLLNRAVDDAPSSTEHAVANRRRLAVYLQHWEALQVLNSQLGPGQWDAMGADEALLTVTQMAWIAAYCPPALLPGSALLGQLKSLVRTILHGKAGVSLKLGAVFNVLQAAASFGPASRGLAVVLANSGLLDMLLAMPAQMGPAALLAVDPKTIGNITAEAVGVMFRIVDCAKELAAALSRASAPLASQGSTAALLQELAGRLEHVIKPVGLPQGLDVLGLLMWMVQLQQRTLPIAKQVAAAVQQHWQQPECQQAAEMAVCQAAAARSCAYLRCSNLTCEGGPAAGEGVGSLKCSACRAVWYCGTACSHADWRQGGHRRACKALAAIRLEEQQPRANCGAAS